MAKKCFLRGHDTVGGWEGALGVGGGLGHSQYYCHDSREWFCLHVLQILGHRLARAWGAKGLGFGGYGDVVTVGVASKYHGRCQENFHDVAPRGYGCYLIFICSRYKRAHATSSYSA